MAKGTATRKQLLKEPDQFITFSGKLIAFGRSHLKAILIGTGTVLALLIAVTIMRQITDRNENRASEQVEQVIASYSAIIQNTDPKTAYERVKAEFTDVFDAYGATSAVKVARIVYGDISYHGQDADTAISMYMQALGDFKNAPALKNIILSGLGHAYLLKNEYPEAIRYFETISTSAEKTMQSGALFNLAWLYAATGEKDKSAATVQQLLTDFPNSRYDDLIKEQIRS